jgi:C4-dicarboxylate-specific signal transduction histidine kinase
LILNLIVNGIDAVSIAEERQRSIWISTRLSAEGAIVVHVRDNGCGVDVGMEEQMFSAFFTTKPSGMGMGLSICRSIAESFGGRLWAEQNMPDPGLSFLLELPSINASRGPSS